ncbi:MAG TPA: squalene--hopene cyclase [Bryobacteraceae bacterium]|nr:squalene--hopene cyclase [Bryobacteraceae bacterium]
MDRYEWLMPAAPRQAPSIHELRAEARALREAAARCVERAGESLIARQHADGYWCADLLGGDISLEADYILTQLWLYQPDENGNWNPPTKRRIEKACRQILKNQMPDGGFWIYPGGPANVNATVKAYAALRVAGYQPNEEPLRRARIRVLELGGLQACNSYTRLNLSLFGLFPRQYVPTVPPELVMVPGGTVPGGILYEMASWTRTILVPLSIVQAVGGVRRAPAGVKLDELYLPNQKLVLPKRDRLLSPVFHQVDRLLKLWERRGHKDIRIGAIRLAERWILERTRNSDGLGAIYPAMQYTLMALDALGYDRDHPDFVEALRQFDGLLTEKEDELYFQPCFSPVWDTAQAMFSLGETGAARRCEEAMRKAADWLLSKEIRRRGDWSFKRPRLNPSGWVFEFNNEHYPDIDDTAMVLLALLHARASDPERQAACEQRAIAWVRGMQSRDGGWAAFDADNDWGLLNRVPFADHNAMLDPTCPDITGRVLESLSRRGIRADESDIQRGVAYLLGTQEPNGSWYGRWGVNYLYGTFLALRGLRAAGIPPNYPPIQKAAQWVQSVQNPDGGWGESCHSYVTGQFEPAPSTPSQTAWALLALEAAGQKDSRAAARGVAHLVETQKDDGTWPEELATGTGFPNVYYLRYLMYAHYFPMLALGYYNV